MTLRKWFQILLVALLLSVPAYALAQSALSQPLVPPECNGIGGCKSVCQIATTAKNVLNFAVYAMVFFSAVMFAWAGWEALTAGGSVEQYTRAKRIFGHVLIGLIIILASWTLIDTLMRTFISDQADWPWNKICQLIEEVFTRHYA